MDCSFFSRTKNSFFILAEFSSKSSLVFFFDMKVAKAIPLTQDAVKRYHLEHRIIFDAIDRSINKEMMKLGLDNLFTDHPAVSRQTFVSYSNK